LNTIEKTIVGEKSWFRQWQPLHVRSV